MSGFTIIEILVSLSFIYVVYSLLGTIVVELIASIFRLRARMLRRAIRRMLQDDDPDLATQHAAKMKNDCSTKQKRQFWLQGRTKDRQFVQQFFDHPTIKYLGKSNWQTTPSYISKDVFSKVVIELLCAEQGYSDTKRIENSIGYYEQFNQPHEIPWDDWNAFIEELGEMGSKEKSAAIDKWLVKYSVVLEGEGINFTNMEVKNLIKKLKDEEDGEKKFNALADWVKKLEGSLQIDDETRLHLCTLYKQSGGSLNEFYNLLGDWFENTMDRTKGWYKKQIGRITFAFGLVVAVGLNVDTVHIVQTLQKDTAKREALVAIVDQADKDSLATIQKDLSKHQGDINNVIALGHDAERTKDQSLPFAILGWLLTAIAISLGAPFWFDMLNKFIKLKTSLPPPSQSNSPPEGDSGKGKYVKIRRQAKG